MKASEVFVNRPVFTTVISLVILLFGIMGFNFLGVREFPQADRPLITVSASYPGASAAVIESQITEPLEEEINTVSGIKSLTSVSREGRSSISVEFEIGDDLDRAANDVRDRVAAAVRRLPDDADPPTVSKADADGDPIVFLNIESGKRTLLDLSDIAESLFKPRLETISGVGQVDIWGEKEYAMRLWLDPDRMMAYGITPSDVRQALQRANVELPSGRIEGAHVDINVRTETRLGSEPEEFERLILRGTGNNVVRFGDIGRAELAAQNERSLLKRNGVPMVGVVVRPQAGANQIEIVDEFYKRIEEIKKDLPEDIRLGIGFDTSTYIRGSISEVQSTVIMALVLVALTIFFFLREWRSSVIPLVTIPVSLIGSFFIMYISGFTINLLTLLAMVLAVGLVVDDAVIVLENIYTKIEEGMPPREAAVAGVREIILAVVATTLSLVAVFTPIVFLGGLTGVLFKEFGISLAGAVVISSIVALTLTPMAASKLLKHRAQHPWFYRKTEPFFNRLTGGYAKTLSAFLNHRWLALPVMLICLLVVGYFWSSLPRELAPLEDRGLLVLTMTGPQGANYDYMQVVTDEIDTTVHRDLADSVETTITMTSPGFGSASTSNSGFSRVVLKPAGERPLTQSEVARNLERLMVDIPGARVSVREPATISTGGRGLPVAYVVQNQNFEKLAAVLPDFLDAARQRPEFSFVDVNLEFTSPEFQVRIDRNRAESFGVQLGDAAALIQSAFSGQRFGYFLKDGRQYDIIGQMDREGRDAPIDLKRLVVRNNQGALISLDNIATFDEVSTAPVLYRYNRFPSATFSASLAPGYTIGHGIDAMEEVAAPLLDETFATDLSGQSREFRDTGQSLLYVFGLALLLVYLVLAAQFESFRDPFTIMLTVPLALAGAVTSLWFFGQTLNIFSQIGAIMLIGLVTKNGILLVEFANQRRQRCNTLREAAESAAIARFRPILMTSISTILGTLPIALALGEGAQSRMPLGIAVIGGLVAGSLLTLYIIPAAYITLASRGDRAA